MLEIRLLGQFDVRRDGAPVAIPSRPAQSLLAYLALTPGATHRREKLAGLLWPEATEANARSYLRKALWQIRKSLGEPDQGDFLTIDEISLTFEPQNRLWLDTAALARSLPTDGPLAEWLEAAGAYRGELLPGFYDEWVVLERERLRAIFDRQLARLLDRLAAEGRWPQVLEWAEHWLGQGGAPEPAYRALMTAHAALGDMANVAAVFERCAQTLRDDLGVEPSPQTRSLYERLIRGEAIPVPASPLPAPEHLAPKVQPSSPVSWPPASDSLTALPVPLTSFIGREQEIEQVKRLLAAARLVTLAGAGGSGKTRLAIQVARHELPAFGDEVGWVELAPLADGALVPGAVAKALGVSEVPGQPLAETLVWHLAARRLLLILDNCEHLVEVCARLAEGLLSACPGLTILATSRETLAVPGERVFHIPTLSVPAAEPVSATRLLHYESVRLFVERAAAVKSDFALNERNAGAVAQVCARLDGIPLAIELAAARIATLKVEQVAARLDDRFQLLTSGSRTALPHHQTLRAAIDWSHELLPEVERTLLRRLSVFAGGWTLEAAEAVGAGHGVDRRAVLDLLAQLTNKSLVLADRKADQEARYRLLDTIRQYGAEKLAEAGEEAAVRDRHLEFFVNLAEVAEPNLVRAEQLGWLQRLETEHDNLRAACEWAAHSENAAMALRLMSSLLIFWFVRGHITEGRNRLAQAQAVPAGREVAAIRARALNAGAPIWWVLDDPTGARPLFEEALALGKELGDKVIVATALRNLAQIVYLRNQPLTALAMLQEALGLWREAGEAESIGAGWALCYCGDAAMLAGDSQAAQAWYDQGIELLTQLQEENVLAYTIRRAGYLAFHRGDYSQAQILIQRSLVLNLEAADTMGLAPCLAGLGGVALWRGHPLQAAKAFGAVEGLSESTSTVLTLLDRLEYERSIAAVRAQLAPEQLAAAWAEGRAMSLDQAVAYALTLAAEESFSISASSGEA